MPKLATLAIFGVIAAGRTAAAQNARYPRPIVVPAVTLSDRVRPAPPPGVARATLDVDAALSIDGVVKPPRLEQEQILVALIQNTPDSDAEEKADYYFRLGELYAAMAHNWRLQTTQAAPSKAKDYLLKTVKTFKGLTDNEAFRNYSKMDIALFEYGYTLKAGRYIAEARAVFDRLLKNYPNSKYVPEAHFVFGEYFFDANQLADAEARYRMVLKFPKSSTYWYAMFRLGQIHHALGRYQEALETFFQVAQATKSDAKLAPMHRTAVIEFARSYAPIGKPDVALAAFKRVDPTLTSEAIDALADAYAAGGSVDKAAAVLRQVRGEPGARPCQAQYKLARALLGTPSATTAARVEAIEQLVAVAGDDCHDDAHAMAGELARAFHAEATKTKNPATVEFAERLYKAELDGFPDAPDREQTRMLYAEARWLRADLEPDATVRAKLWERAAEAFAAVPTQDAAHAAVLAWRNALDLDAPEVLAGEVDLAKARAAAATPKPIADRDLKLLAAFDAYAQYATDADDELVTAIVLRRYHHDDKTVAILTSFLAHHRDHASAELAANLLLEALIYLRRYDDVLATVDRLAADARFVDGKPRLKRNIEWLRSRSLRGP